MVSWRLARAAGAAGEPVDLAQMFTAGRPWQPLVPTMLLDGLTGFRLTR
jgi:hypothetical protein